MHAPPYTFKDGDLVYYTGFEVFETHKQYIGIVVKQRFEEHYRGGLHYSVFWFDSGLTTRMHCDNIILVYEKESISEE